MPRLQILQHKSYHPYLQSNKDKVAKDEREQKEREDREELRVLQADSEARLTLLRNRSDPSAGPTASSSTSYLPPPPPPPTQDPFYASEPDRKVVRKPKREKDDMKELERRLAGKPSKGKDRERDLGGRSGSGGQGDDMFRGKDGHLNLWAGEEGFVGPPKPIAPPPPPKSQEEQQKDEPYTMFLSRTERELKPWYVDPSLKRYDERGEPRDDQERARREKIKRKDALSKTSRDPLTHISTLLPSHPLRPSSHPHYPPPHLPLSRPPAPPGSLSPTSTRLAREASERARAQALIYASAKARAPPSSSGSTPAVSRGSTVGGRTPGYEERRFFPEEVRRVERERERGGHGYGRGLDQVRWDEDRRSETRRSSGGSERGRDAGGRWREV